MRKKVLEVEDAFQIKGRGLIVTGKTLQNAITVKVGESLIIVSPKEKEITVKLLGVEMLSPPVSDSLGLAFANLSKEDIPIGSEIFAEVDE